MSGQPLYLCYPSDRNSPLCGQWIAEVVALIASDPQWADWELRFWQCDDKCSINKNDLFSAVNGDVGPCVMVRPVQESVFVDLRERLYSRAVVLVGDVVDSTDLFALLVEARAAHLKGDPMLPRKLVVASMLLNKLDQNRMWGGHNRKGFMWVDDLKNGRGFDVKFADQLGEVLGDLISAGLVQGKKSKTSHKVALVRERQIEIFRALESGQFPPGLDRILKRDPRVESARELDALRDRRRSV